MSDDLNSSSRESAPPEPLTVAHGAKWRFSVFQWVWLSVSLSCAFGLGVYQWYSNSAPEGIAAVIGFILIGVLGVWYDHDRRLTPEQKAAVVAKELREAQSKLEYAKREEEVMRKWYVRYPFAGAMLWAAYTVMERNEDRWWIALIFVVVAAFKAWELTLLVLVGWGLLALWEGFRELSVAGAIIVGAIIIAAAISGQRRG